MPYVGLEDIESGTARFTGSIDPAVVRSTTFRFSPEHVLYGRLRPYLSKVMLPEFIGHCSTEIFPLKPHPELLRRFLMYWLIMSETVKRIDATSTGTRMPRANMSEVLGFALPLPSVDEQQRIVAILDEAFDDIANAIANAEKNLANSRAVFASSLHSVFAEAWRIGEPVTLADLATDITDGDHMPPPKSSSGVPFITIGCIAKETRSIDFSRAFTVPHDYFDALKPNKRPRNNDVLYTVTGSFGIPIQLTEDRDFCFQRHIGLVRPAPETDSTWLYYLLMSPQVAEQAETGATGAAQRTVSLRVLRGYRVPRLPIALQRDAVAELDAVSRETQNMESIYRRKLAALDELKRSLLHEAFSGNL